MGNAGGTRGRVHAGARGGRARRTSVERLAALSSVALGEHLGGRRAGRALPRARQLDGLPRGWAAVVGDVVRVGLDVRHLRVRTRHPRHVVVVVCGEDDGRS
eukprot:4250229-Prymnesium_polylepis.1